MYRNKKTRRKLNDKSKYGGNPSCSIQLETDDKCKWGATKRRCMRLTIDSTPLADDKPQTDFLPNRILMNDIEYPSIVDKINPFSPPT